MIFFYADPHFQHKNILNEGFENHRKSWGISSIEEMTETLITKHNEKVTEHDTVVWVGDCSLGSHSNFKEILKRMNGVKICVKGNHDMELAKMMKIGFTFACYSYVTKVAGHVVTVCHFPYSDVYQGVKNQTGIDKAPRYNGKWLIHGHVHSKWKVREDFRMINVGVDVWNGYPVSAEEVGQIIQSCEHKFAKSQEIIPSLSSV